MGYDRRDGPTVLDRAIRDFYTGQMEIETFMEKYWHDSWESLIKYVELSGFNMRNGQVPKQLLERKQEYEEVLVDYYLAHIINMEIGNQYYESIEKADIKVCLAYLQETKQFSSKSVEETLRQYLSGQIPEISRQPVSRSVPKKENSKAQERGSNKKDFYVWDKIIDFYNGRLTVGRFIKGFSGTWEDVLDTIVSNHLADSKENISGDFLAKKEEFEKAVIKCFGKDYCEMTQILVNGRYVHPTQEDVKKTIKYLQKNNKDLGKGIISETLRKYLRGEIQLDKEEVKKKTVDELQVEEVQEEAPQADEVQIDETQTEEIQVDEPQVDEMQLDEPQPDNVPSRTIDLGAMREQRGKCEQLAMQLQQMQGDLDIKKDRLRELQQIVSQPNIDISKIQEFAGEMLTLAQQINESQNAVDGLDIQRLAGEQQLRKMKDAAIAEIEEI